MIYPKNPYCPMNNTCPPSTGGDNNTGGGNIGGGNNNMGGGSNNTGGGNNMGNSNNMSCDAMMQKIHELEFAITDLNLYLDTHPDNREALEMLTQLSSTAKSMMYDYSQKCGPIVVTDVSNNTPFEWVQGKWPWQA